MRLVPGLLLFLGCSNHALGVDSFTWGCTTEAACGAGFHCVAGVCQSAMASDAGGSLISFVGVQQVGPVSGELVGLARPDVHEGDLMMIALFLHNAGTGAGAVVTGLDTWQPQVDLTPGSTHLFRVFTRVATAQEPARFSVQLTAANSDPVVSGILVAWSGTSATVPIDVMNTQVNDTSYALPVVTTNFDHELLVAVVSADEGSGARWTPPTGMRERASTGVLGVFEVAWPTPGPSEGWTYENSSTLPTSGAAVFALRPR